MRRFFYHAPGTRCGGGHKKVLQSEKNPQISLVSVSLFLWFSISVVMSLYKPQPYFCAASDLALNVETLHSKTTKLGLILAGFRSRPLQRIYGSFVCKVPKNSYHNTGNRIKHQTEHAMETKRIGAPKLHGLQISSLAQALIFKTSSPEFKP